MWYIYIYIHTHIHKHNGILLSHKTKWNFAICNNVNGLGGYYAKWNKSDRERQILFDITNMWNLKNKTTLVNITKKKQTHRYKDKTSG